MLIGKHVSESIVSPFSVTGGTDLETLDFIATGFKYLDNYRRHLISKDPQLAALTPDYHIQLPGASMQELRATTLMLVDCIATFRQHATG